MSKKNSV